MQFPAFYTCARALSCSRRICLFTRGQVAHGPSGAGGYHLVSPSRCPLRLVTFSFRRFSFATVGMFSAVSNLGAGGLQDVALSDTANGVLYGTFAVTGLISGGINNGSFVCPRSDNQLLQSLLLFSRPPQFSDLGALSLSSVQVSSSAVNNTQVGLTNLGHSGLCALCRCSLGVCDLSRQQSASADRYQSSNSGYAVVLDFCRRAPRYHRRFTLVCPGMYHDELSSREG